MQRPKKTISTVVVLAALAAAASGCSSGGSSSGGSSNGGSSNGAENDTKNAAAQAVVTPYLSPPKEIQLSQLAACPPKGKLIVINEGPEPVAHQTTASTVAIAKLLGWNTKVIQFGTDPNAPQVALDAALAQKPDAVITYGTPRALIQAQLQRATSLGIPVMLSDNAETPGVTGKAYQTNINGSEQVGIWGKLTAAYAAAQGAKHALVVNLSQYPVLQDYTNAVTSTLTKYGVKSSVLNTTAADLASGADPGKIVAELQRSPDIDWILLSLGDMTTGLQSALSAAGIANRVKIGGEAASTANLQALKNGTEAVWVGFPTAIVGAYRLDAVARLLSGEDPTKVDYITPTQLLTPNNINSAPFGAGGYYLGIPTYSDVFKHLWTAHC
jgi:ABC-type sugar transport system substrate-binding protein